MTWTFASVGSTLTGIDTYNNNNNNNNNNNESISTAQNKKILRCAGWHKKFSVSVQMSEPCT